MGSTPVRCEVFYSGQVQGVGFRYNARNLARDFAVTGMVRNLPDGRVHLIAEGDQAEVDRFLKAIAESMAGNIRDAETTIISGDAQYPRFEIGR